MDYKSTTTETEDLTRTVQDFNFQDRLGRTIGIECSIMRRVYVTIPEDSRGWSNIAPGTWFVARAQATRNGKSYGASQSGQFFRTLEEAEAYLAKRVTASEKAAAKKGTPLTTQEG